MGITNSLRMYLLGAATVAAALLPGVVAADEVPIAIAAVSAEDIAPTSTVSAGVAVLGADNQRFGEHTGLDSGRAYGLLDMDVTRLERDSGTWLRLRGRNLGLDSREASLEHERQGDWGYSLAYNRMPHNTPYDINTGLTGAGTDQLARNVITPGAGAALRLSTDREVLRAAGRKHLPMGVDVEVSFRNEEKQGERLYGRTGIDFLVDPIDYTTRQWEATVAFSGEPFQIVAGYYATSFSNRFTGLVVDGVTDGDNNTYSPIGLPPDNVSHQLYVSGGYTFTPVTRGTFKVSYGRVTQDDAFIQSVTVAPGVGNNLDGRIDTTRVDMAVSSRPARRLSLLGSFRHENRNDKTPVRVYYTGANATSRTNGENEPRDIRATAGKVEATYRLADGLHLTGGVDRENTHRNISAVRSVSARDETRETTYRLVLRRSMAENVNGSLTYLNADRNGSDFAFTTLNGGGAGANNIAPVHYADRRRQKLRLMMDAMPSERLSLQLVADTAWDRYHSRTAQNLGPRKGDWRHVSVDGTLVLTPAWTATAFVSYDRGTTGQSSCDGISSSGAPCDAASLWSATLENRGYAGGLGVRGDPTDNLTVGADVQQSYDTGRYRQTGTPATSMPDLYYKPLTVTLFGDYALTRQSGVGVSVTYDRRKTNDWAWAGWTYGDGTTVFQDPDERVVFAGVRYHYAWR